MPNLKQLLDVIWAEIAAAPSFIVELGPLTLSVTEAEEGTAVVSRIAGQTAGGRVSVAPPDGMAFDPTALTIAGIPTTAGEYDIALRETHPQGSNSPRVTVIRFTVSPPPMIPDGPWSFDSDTITFDRIDVTFDGSVGGGSTPTARAFLSDPFLVDPVFNRA